MVMGSCSRGLRRENVSLREGIGAKNDRTQADDGCYRLYRQGGFSVSFRLF
jgi:hypothetical protein